MRKFVNIVLIICVVALVLVIGLVVYFVGQKSESNTIGNVSSDTANKTKPTAINDSSDLVDALNDQIDEEFDYLSAIDDESLLVDSDKTELTNISEAYGQNDF